MPEYLAPGVYVEEVDTGSKPIEGVSTSTSGMVGVTERGPVNEPSLVTGFADFTRQFGGFLNRRVVQGANWLFPHAVDGFFTNGGKRLYVVRVLPQGATYAGMQLFAGVAGGFAGALESGSRPGDVFLVVDDPAGLGAGDWVLLEDSSRTEYVRTSSADVLVLRSPLAAGANASDAVTPFTFADVTGAGALTTNPTNATFAGDQQDILLDDTTGLTAAGGDILAIGTGGTAEYVVTTGADLMANTVDVAAPLAFDHAVTEDVVLVTANAGPATQLEHAAATGSWLIVVRDESFLAGADAIAFGAAMPTEYATLGDLGVVGLPTGLRFRHAAGTSVVTPTMTDIGPDRTIDPAAAAGDTEIALSKRDDLTVGMVLLLTGASGSEYAVIESIDPTPGAGAGDPGLVTLTNPLQLAYEQGATAHPFQDAVTDSDATVLARAADAGDDVALLVDQANHAAGDLVRVEAAGLPRVEYFQLVATTADLVSLETAPGETHPAGTALSEHAPLADVRAIDRGAWGNSLRVTAIREERPTVSTVVTTGGGAGAPSIEVRTAVGIEVGTLLEFMTGTTVSFRQKVEGVSGRTVSFGPAGLEQTVVGGTNVRSADFALAVQSLRTNPRTLKDEPDAALTETFRNLTLDPRHTRYFVRVIGQIQPTVDDRGEGESSLIRVADLLPAAAAQQAERPSPDLLGQGVTVSAGLQTLPVVTFDVEDTSTFPGSGSFDVLGNTITYTGTTATSFTGSAGGGGDVPDATLVTQTGGPIGLRLRGGSDELATLGDLDLIGTDAVDPADRTGLQALKTIEEISIVALPGRTSTAVQNALLSHCELMRYRFAVLDSLRGSEPNGARLDQVQTQRSLYDSKYGALYYPWLVIDDPFPQNPSVPEPVWIPPSGHMIGIYARSDNERGVHKAPANEVVRGITDLQVRVVKEQHDILNPRNVNVIRNFRDRGRGLRVWGARVVSSDPDWRYVNVRRLFNFVEASIERGTQWVVFEPNDFALWARVTQSVEAFLTAVWRDGALMGRTADEAFYVRCDETTMSQYDIDNGRLIMLIGIAPVKPAEFVIIRIGQWAGGSLVEEA